MADIVPEPEDFADIAPSPRAAPKRRRRRAARGLGAISAKSEGKGTISAIFPSSSADILYIARFQEKSEKPHIIHFPPIDKHPEK